MSDMSIIKPIYQQISLDIASRIANGEFQIGSKIHGRSTLASEYNVSPETIRRAVILLEDMNIVEVAQGSGIKVVSIEEAYKFIKRFNNKDSMISIKKDIEKIISDKEKLDCQLNKYVDKLLDYTERFKNLNPFAPLEIEITSDSKIVGKTISEVKFWQNTGATIIGIRRNGTLILSPGPYAIFMENDVFIVIGDENSHERIQEFFKR